jgi:hypothetical protein
MLKHANHLPRDTDADKLPSPSAHKIFELMQGLQRSKVALATLRLFRRSQVEFFADLVDERRG